MWQFFHTQVDDLVLFEGWKIDSAGSMVLACAITAVFGITFEFVKWARKKVVADLKLRQDPNASPTLLQALFTASHLVGTFFFALQLTIGYLLMLIVMTFSVWLGLSVVVGATLGFIIFGDRE
ncbi:hypothetical protein PRIPAC_73438 [Pristionchus pacificus]|uniref:Copper transport protein n=1 Tax=Pristionchus pacificus TaxID=54126 RepID=A0A454XSR5_PRIPA|nr:hypothetical protein PRIPAC_73438 [Pristionchus pacificus]|eukprot:PDM76790.1 hypothetical protein PRIPAC_42185 [Pristionchus pacificus]